MAICQFFQRGTCRYGSACKNEHVQTVVGNQTYVRPGADKVGPYTVDSIKNDLTMGKERPIWPLASYAPAKYELTLLTGLDESPDELRLKATTATKAGNINEYLAYESSKIAAAEQVFSNAVANVYQAYEQATKNSDGGATSAGPSAFGGASAGTSAFGKPAFAQPAFGQSAFAKPTTSVFGGQSSFGQAAPSSVIKPATGFAAFSSGGGSAFGAGAGTSTATTSEASGGGFSAFAGKPSVFSATPAAGGGSVFGQSSFGTPAPSAFGVPTQPAAPTSVFSSGGSVFSNNPTGSAFGQTGFGQKPVSAFGQTGFGNSAAAPAAAPPASGGFSAFASTAPTGFSAFSSAAPAAAPSANGGGFSAFATPAAAQPAGAFSSATPPGNGGAFGAFSSTTPAAAPPVNAFNAFSAAPSTAFPAAKPTTVTNAFGNLTSASSGFNKPTSAFGAFGDTPASSPFFNASSQPTAPIVSAFGNMNSSLPTAGGQPAFGGQSQPQPAQSFSSGPPPPDFKNVKVSYRQGLTPYDSQLPPDYLSRLPESVVAAFRAEKFEWGKIPDWVPPLELR